MAIDEAVLIRRQKMEGLKEALSAALEGKIGRYTFKNAAATVPAIRVEDGADLYPEEPIATELEVVIKARPGIQIQSTFQGFGKTVSFVIFLKQWNPKKSCMDDLETVLGVIQESFDLLIPTNRFDALPRESQAQLFDAVMIPVEHSFLDEPVDD